MFPLHSHSSKSVIIIWIFTFSLLGISLNGSLEPYNLLKLHVIDAIDHFYGSSLDVGQVFALTYLCLIINWTWIRKACVCSLLNFQCIAQYYGRLVYGFFLLLRGLTHKEQKCKSLFLLKLKNMRFRVQQIWNIKENVLW